MARPAIYARVRISVIERRIAWYKFRQLYQEEVAIRFLVQDMGIRLDEARIVDYVSEYAKYHKGA